MSFVEPQVPCQLPPHRTLGGDFTVVCLGHRPHPHVQRGSRSSGRDRLAVLPRPGAEEGPGARGGSGLGRGHRTGARRPFAPSLCPHRALGAHCPAQADRLLLSLRWSTQCFSIKDDSVLFRARTESIMMLPARCQ